MNSTSTKLSLFCDKVLEAGWLLGVIITPLFFNVYSSRVFEPDKLTTLRTVALIMATAWVTQYVEERVSGRRELGITWRTPLVLPTLFTVIVYILSTALSVTWRVSLYGSYQRLQGTYTTLSYIVIFLVILQRMRRREQLNRLVTVVILNSIPIALYGLLQRNRLDPLPWGGDVTIRIASNMGNAIFVAAYMIMVTPITVGRIVQAFRSILAEEGATSSWTDVPRAAAYIFILLIQLIATVYTQSRGPLLGILAGLGMWGVLGLLILQQAARREKPFHPTDLPNDLLRGLAFGLGSTAGAGLVAVAVYFAARPFAEAESDLPQGLAAIAAILVLLGVWLTFVVNRRGWRWLWASALIMGVFASAGFFAINPGGPLYEWSQSQPALARLARVLDPESGTGMVRNLIWQGGVKLYLPHEPLKYPPTREHPEGYMDPLNALRPLVGYGPESMYVAYNPFYPPLLGHFESRTASPDRSHNETLDSLIITGLLGFIAYLGTFGSVFYFGLHWMGFLPADWRRTLFIILMVVSPLVAVAIVVPTVGAHFFCLAIPIGLVGGLFLYTLIYGFSVYWDARPAGPSHPHLIILAGFLCAIVAHFVEINFGIAIASTRTTFWAYAGAFVVAGLGLIRGPATETAHEPTAKEVSRKRRRRREIVSPPPPTSALPTWLWATLAAAVIGGFVLGTLSFDFITNAERLSQPGKIIWRALTILATRNETTCPSNYVSILGWEIHMCRWDPVREECRSYGALLVFTLTWLFGGLVFMTEMAGDGAFKERKGDGWLATLLYLVVALAVGFGFALTLAGGQAALMNFQARTIQDVLALSDRVAGFVGAYYGFILCTLIGLGVLLLMEIKPLPREIAQPWGVLALLVLAVLAGAIAVTSNLQPIKADIIYKQADPYDRSKQWTVAIEHYNHAIDMAPYEDFYYLYLGRAYLEYASSVEDPVARKAIMQETEKTLLEARELNPLNTDHSANLARMYRRWADFAQDADERRALLQKSSENYTLATMLSPQNAILWNEWAMLYYYGLGDVENYQRTLDRSLELDPDFDQTWLVCGDANRQQNKLDEAAHCYEEALRINPKATQVWRALGDTYIAAQRWEAAIHALTKTLELQPDASDAWNIHQVVARLYVQMEQYDQALIYAQNALDVAPEEQKAALTDLVAQIQQLGKPQ